MLKTNGQRSSASGLVNAALVHLGTAGTRTMGTFALIKSLCGEIQDSLMRDNMARQLYETTDCR